MFKVLCNLLIPLFPNGIEGGEGITFGQQFVFVTLSCQNFYFSVTQNKIKAKQTMSHFDLVEFVIIFLKKDEL